MRSGSDGVGGSGATCQKPVRILRILPEPQLAYNPSDFLPGALDYARSNSMTPFLRKLLGQNWLLLVTMLALAIFGVVAIYSATSSRADSYAADFWRKQANWVAVGVFAFMITSLIDYRWVRWGVLPMYLAGIVFLILTKFMGTKVYGARSWLHLGPLNFQPAQLAVVAGIMVLALSLTYFREVHPMLRLLLCGAVAAAPCILILMQPDLGEVIIWIPVLLALL